MQELDKMDLHWAVLRLPGRLKRAMTEGKYRHKIFVGGGYLRSIVAGEPVNDVDVFVESYEAGKELAELLKYENEKIHETDNAFTLPKGCTIQIIHRWRYNNREDVCNDFDFTICMAIIEFCAGRWESCCNDRFYVDLAAKRLVYTNPQREEEAGGSMLRVLKYYQKGYRIPLDSLGMVMARVFAKVDDSKVGPEMFGKVITGLLREVDPATDPFNIAHLPDLQQTLMEKDHTGLDSIVKE